MKYIQGPIKKAKTNDILALEKKYKVSVRKQNRIKKKKAQQQHSDKQQSGQRKQSMNHRLELFKLSNLKKDKIN